jgi:hypothetical protein
MSTNRQTRDLREIEADLDQTRTRMGDTLDALQHKLTPGELFEDALSYFRSSGGGEFASNLGATVKQNPVPVTLVGLGLAWLALSARGDSSRAKGTGSYEDPYRLVDEGSMSAELTTQAYSDPTSSTPSDESGETGPGVGQRVAGAAAGARGKAGDAAHRARGGMAHIADSSRDRMHQMSEGTRRGMHRMSEAGRYQAERVRSGFEHMLHEQPLVLGAIGVALGAALAAGLPRTRREDELMGEARDEVMSRAQEKGREQLDKV